MRGDARVPYPLGVCQSGAYTATAWRSAAVGAQTRAVLVSASTDAYYLFGDSGVTATSANGTFIPAGGEHYVRIPPGSYVSVVRVTADGTAHVSEMDG